MRSTVALKAKEKDRERNLTGPKLRIVLLEITLPLARLRIIRKCKLLDLRG